MRHFDLLTEQVDFKTDMIRGLSSQPKRTSPKHLYDRRGSQLFDEECDQPEYYLPTAETEIFERHADDMAKHLNSRVCIIEPGSGAATKVRALLDNVDTVEKYVPVDISTEFMKKSAQRLEEDYPELAIDCVSADFTQISELPPAVDENFDERLVFFPGSTIGNLEPPEAERLLTNFRSLADPSGYLLIGVDLRKDPEVIERAYNDEAGIGARLHTNLLRRANRELGADFDPAGFRYRAAYNPSKNRMEMYLVSRREQEVAIDGRTFTFNEGEAIHTQCSYKYSLDEFRSLAEKCGFSRVDYWLDSNRLFSVQLYRTRPIGDG